MQEKDSKAKLPQVVLVFRSAIHFQVQILFSVKTGHDEWCPDRAQMHLPFIISFPLIISVITKCGWKIMQEFPSAFFIEEFFDSSF
jgi:hypothetical protein